MRKADFGSAFRSERPPVLIDCTIRNIEGFGDLSFSFIKRSFSFIQRVVAQRPPTPASDAGLEEEKRTGSDHVRQFGRRPARVPGNTVSLVVLVP